MEKVESITGSCKFALRFALECDFETTRVSAIYINTPLDTFTPACIQVWQVH